MKIPVLSYDAEVTQKRKDNLQQVVSGNIDAGIELKMSEFALRHNISVSDVKKYCKDIPGYAELFAKSPQRQNIFEDLAAAHITKYLADPDTFMRLPSGGPNALHVVEGVGVVKGSNLSEDQKRNRRVKSIDFAWKVGTTWVFVSHKFTKDEGGSQDNQHHDLQVYLKAAASLSKVITLHDGTKTSDVVFLAVCDGPYYQKTVRINAEETATRQEELSYIGSNSENVWSTVRVSAQTINSLPAFQEALRKRANTTS